jgi:hypothetical protein
MAVALLAASVISCTGAAQSRVEMNVPLAVEVTWSYVSANSAAIGVETTCAAKTYVEYGPTAGYGTKTPATDAHFQHLHHLKGLKPDEVVHFRVVAAGEDGKKVTTADATLTPKAPENVVRVPDEVPGPPFVLDKKDATYLVTKDLVCDGSAFEVKADGITIDFNGFTVTYDNKEQPRPQAAWNVFRNEAPMGIRALGRGTKLRILNGTLKQGEANSKGVVPGVGFNPIFISGIPTEVAGIHAIWSGDDVGGFFLHGGAGHHVHHCVTEDLGSGITNRHQAICNIGYAGDGEVDHCLVKRSRHRAINAFTNVHHNEVHVDSQATNAFGVDAPKGKPTEIHHNRIYGEGEHPIGIGATGNVQHLRVWANYVEVQNTKGGTEYGSTGSACYRMTWGGEVDDVEVYDNVFVLHAKKDAFEYNGRKMDSHGRAIWIGLPVKDEDPNRTKPRTILHHNTIIANNAGDGAKAAGIAVVCLNETPWLVFEDNRVESNWGNVLLSDSYGYSGGYPKFIRNTFVRVGNQENYRTVRDGYRDRPSTAEFVDNKYENGAGLDKVEWTNGPHGDNAKEIRVSHDLTVTGTPGADVTIKARDGQTVFEGKIAADGRLTVAIRAASVTPQGMTGLTPHTITVTKDGQASTKTVELDGPKTLEF